MTSTQVEQCSKRESADYWLMFGGAGVIAVVALALGASAVLTASFALGWLGFGWIGSSPSHPPQDGLVVEQEVVPVGTVHATGEVACPTKESEKTRASSFSVGWLLVRVFGAVMLFVLSYSPGEFFTAETTLETVAEWMAVAFVIGLVVAPQTTLVAAMMMVVAVISLWTKGSRPTEAPASSGQILTPRDAEDWVADWMRRNGFAGVRVTPATGDMGLDVLADGWCVQVKRTATPVGRPVLQGLVGATTPGSSSACFSSGGYTSGAIQYARERGVRLYTFAADGSGEARRVR